MTRKVLAIGRRERIHAHEVSWHSKRKFEGSLLFPEGTDVILRSAEGIGCSCPWPEDGTVYSDGSHYHASFLLPVEVE